MCAVPVIFEIYTFLIFWVKFFDYNFLITIFWNLEKNEKFSRNLEAKFEKLEKIQKMRNFGLLKERVTAEQGLRTWSR